MSYRMKAMIFAAGLGTRLRPLTDNKPKALVEVGGVPMLERVILRLKQSGIGEMVINVHHFGQQIVDFVRSNNDFGVKIHISDERDLLLDTGGGILKARQWLDGDEPVIIHNADILTDFDLSSMLTQHRIAEADATLLVAERDTARYFVFDKSMRLRGWTNVKTGDVKPLALTFTGDDVLRAFGGVHIVSHKVFESLESYSDNPKFSITSFYIDKCRELNIGGYTPRESYQWHDIGKLESLKIAETMYNVNSDAGI